MHQPLRGKHRDELTKRLSIIETKQKVLLQEQTAVSRRLTQLQQDLKTDLDATDSIIATVQDQSVEALTALQKQLDELAKAVKQLQDESNLPF
jgi:predicted transcriptional regulator